MVKSGTGWLLLQGVLPRLTVPAPGHPVPHLSLMISCICCAYAQSLTTSVITGPDPGEAKRLWLSGWAKIADIRIGKNP
jgi:hypothetical protein